MAVWVDGTGLGQWRGWVADMGVWTGEWPLRYPEVFDGLVNANGDEIHYRLALPNPADPADVTQALDDTYPTKMWDTSRIDTGPTDVSWNWSGLGGSSPPVYGEEPPSGVHLYLLAVHFDSETSSDQTFPPPYPPELYVPPSQADGGTAAESAWGWTGWHPGEVFDESVHFHRGTHWTSDLLSAGSWFDASLTADPDFDAAFGDAMIGSADVQENGPTGSIFRAGGAKSAIPPGAAASCDVAQWSWDYDPTYVPPVQPEPGELGDDWYYPPFQPYNPDWRWYEFPGPVEWTWSDFFCHGGGYFGGGSGAGVRTWSTNCYIGWRADSIVTPGGSGVYTTANPPVQVPMRSTDRAETTDARAYAVSLSGNPGDTLLPPPRLTMLACPQCVYTGSWDSNAGSAVAWPPDYDFVWSFDITPGTVEATGATPTELVVTYLTHRWRWWGRPTAVLKTIGENFLTPGDVVVKSLVPGYGWVPVQRHG